MTQRQSLAASSGTSAVPKPIASHAVPIVASAETINGAAPTWDEYFCALPASKQAELLGLASSQGLLYGHQLPAATGGAVTDVGKQFLSRLQHGQGEAIEPLRPAAMTFLDHNLDREQKIAVARAVRSPDICLIQGYPGTGKSRIVLEIARQAAKRGERILLLAPSPPAVDRVLASLPSDDCVCALRCVGREEKPDDLAAPIRALTWVERARRIREESLTGARAEIERSRFLVECLRQDESRLAGLTEFQARHADITRQAGLLQAESEDLCRRVTLEAEQAGREGSPASPFGAALLEAKRILDESIAKAQAHEKKLKLESATLRDELSRLRAEMATAAPIVGAWHKGRWWTIAWWQALVNRQVVARWAELGPRAVELEQGLASADEKSHASHSEREAASRLYQETLAHLLSAEIRQRQLQIEDRRAALAQEQHLIETKWLLIRQELESRVEVPGDLSLESLARCRESWETATRRAAERAALAEAWATFLESSAETLAERWPGYANLVASTVTHLASDEHYGDHGHVGAGSPVTFDLLILEEADQVTEAEFLRVSRRARRWVLVGETRVEELGSTSTVPANMEPRARRDWQPKPLSRPAHAAPLRSAFFQRLWRHLHLDQVWVRESSRLCCRLRPVASEQRQWLERETVADSPDVELHILSLPNRQPVLAEISFPGSMTLPQAKQYVFQQLEQLPVSGDALHPEWIEESDRVILRLTDEQAVQHESVPLAAGICEMISTAGQERNGTTFHPLPGRTCSLAFERKAGWNQDLAEKWIQRHLDFRDLGRTARLTCVHRMTPPLGAILASILGCEARLAGRLDGPASAVEFVPVPALQPERTRSRNERGRGGADTSLSLAAQISRMKGGAGLELDLSDVRHRDRLPSELRPLLPRQGLVNYLEAQAVTRLVHRLSQHEPADTRLAVIALYSAQAELIRYLLQNTPWSGGKRDVEVGLPGTFRHREADIILVSLTRSHTHRAVSYGDGPHLLGLALTRARRRLILVGDPGTLHRRCQWEAALDHLDEDAAARERAIVARLVEHLLGRGPHQQAFLLREGIGP